MARLDDTTYDIARPTGVCAASGRPIRPGDEYVGALLEGPAGERLQRLDYSPQAWAAGIEFKPPHRLLGYWRGTMPEPDAPKRPVIDDAALIDLFEQLGADPGDRSRVAFRYVLALVLVRKRLLKVEGNRERTMLLRWARQEQGAAAPVEVVDPGMDEETVAAVIEQLGALVGAPGPAGGPP